LGQASGGTTPVAVWQIAVFSAGGAAENSPRRQPWVSSHKNHQPRQGRQIKSFVCFLPPRPGLEFLWMIPSRVSPWVIIVRRFATSNRAGCQPKHLSADFISLSRRNARMLSHNLNPALNRNRSMKLD